MCESKKEECKKQRKSCHKLISAPQELPAPEAVPASRNESVAFIITELQLNHH